MIGQAKGILMARENTTAEQAFDLLVADSQQTNRKLVDVARQLVNDHQLPQDRSPGPRPAGDGQDTR